MEVILRCELPDRPGALATLAAAISEAGGDIHAIEVVEVSDARALDDLVVELSAGRAQELLDRVRALEEVEVVHIGPSRGHPGDAVTRLAVGIEALLSGAMTDEHAVETLVGGLLRATTVEIRDGDGAVEDPDCELALPLGEEAGAGMLVARRDYRFTHAERERAEAILRACHAASSVGSPSRDQRPESAQTSSRASGSTGSAATSAVG